MSPRRTALLTALDQLLAVRPKVAVGDHAGRLPERRLALLNQMGDSGGRRTDVRQRFSCQQLAASGRPPVRLRCPQLRWFGARESRSCADKPTDHDGGRDRDRNPDAQEDRHDPCHIASLFRLA